MRLLIRVAPAFREQVDRKRLRRLVKETASSRDAGEDVELSLVITDDDTVRCLNRRYRGQDRATDVLSFALEADGGKGEGQFVMPPEESAHLGEVIVSYPAAARQAVERGGAVEDELALLVVHGVLHLLGYDHDSPAAKREMKAMERMVLTRVLGQPGRDWS